MNTKRITCYLLIILAFIIFISDIFQKLEYSPDDTFIYLQYAKNIADGNGFSFNAGQPSYGVTSPIWVIILTLPYFFGLDGFWFSKLTDLICSILAVIMFFRFTKVFFNKEDILRYLAVSIFILNPWFIRWSFTGMETSFAVLLVITAFYFFYRQKYNYLFFTLGILYLTRPETALLTLIFFAIILYRALSERNFKISKFFKYVIFFGITVVPFVIYAKYSFGTIMPNTALGKSTLTLSVSVIINQLKEIFKTLSASSIIELLLALIFLITAYRKKSLQNTAPLLLWILGLISLYIVTDADIISRYLLIISPFFIIIGIKALEPAVKYRLHITLILFVVSTLFSQLVFYKFVKPSTDDFTKGVNECFIPIGKWLSENTAINSKILVNDVGAIGYYSHRNIIDAAALVNSDLDLNKQIMSIPVEERLSTHNLLKVVNADYVIDRDTSKTNEINNFYNYKLELQFMKEFPSLGIKDSSPRYYKVYKVIK